MLSSSAFQNTFKMCQGSHCLVCAASWVSSGLLGWILCSYLDKKSLKSMNCPKKNWIMSSYDVISRQQSWETCGQMKKKKEREREGRTEEKMLQLFSHRIIIPTVIDIIAYSFTKPPSFLLHKEIINPHWLQLAGEHMMDFIGNEKMNGIVHWWLRNEATLPVCMWHLQTVCLVW